MKLLFKLILLTLVMIGFTQCSSAQKLEKEAPFKTGKVYFQSWVAGIKGGGSGVNIFIPVESTSKNIIDLDSVYFRGKASKLETKLVKPNLFIGRFYTAGNRQTDIVMSNEPNAEYGNEVPKIPKPIPFELGDNECVVSYIIGNRTMYYKIVNVVEERPINYPSAPPNRQ